MEGTKLYVNIIKNSVKLKTNHFLFRINPNYLDIILEKISALDSSVRVIEDNGNKCFLYVTRNT